VIWLNKLHVGVIGAGKMGLLHSGIFNSLDNSKLIAVSDKDGFLVRALNTYLPRVHIYQSYREMIEKENLDIVVIATPIFLHNEMIQDSMAHGLAIFVEKPLALNGQECRSILNKNYNNTTLVGYCRRFMETYNLAKNIINNEYLGNVNFLNSHIYVSQIFKQSKGWLYNPKMSGGGVLIDLGSHGIDMFHYLFGDIQIVNAFANSVFNKEVEDYISINLRFKSQTFGSLQVSWSTRNYRLPEFRIDMQLDEGAISVTEKYINIYSEVNSDFIKKGWNTYYKQDLAKNVPINIAGPEYTLEDLHFLNCASENTGTRCDFYEAAKTNLVIDKIYSSVEKKAIETISYEV
jgi:predicted dehydrogenase